MSDRFSGFNTVPVGTTSLRSSFRLKALTTGAGCSGLLATNLCGCYFRPGAAAVPIAFSDLTAVGCAFIAGGVLEVDATRACGLYYVDIPDGAWASGADWVEVSITNKVGSCEPDSIRYTLTNLSVVGC